MAAWALFVSAITIIALPAGWWATDVIESENDFCNSCHLTNGSPLHRNLRENFDARPPGNLAARHAALRLRERPDSPNFRCIDCHGGVGLIGRARVKLLSVKDGFLYLTGQFEEPKSMSWPLLDDDCRQCHTSFARKSHGFDGEAFHNKPGHNESLGVDCVQCHSAHDQGAQPDLWYLCPIPVRARCAQCHVEYRQS